MGRDFGLRWLGLAHTGEWALLREELLRSALDGDISDRPTRVDRLVSGEGRPPDPVDAQDFVTVLSSLLTQDTSLRLPGLSTRTLIVGSGQDLFYPDAALRDLADAIPVPPWSFSRRTNSGPRHNMPASCRTTSSTSCSSARVRPSNEAFPMSPETTTRSDRKETHHGLTSRHQRGRPPFRPRDLTLDLEYWHVDVFSRSAFHGNGLVVVLGADGLDTDLQQQLTREVRQFETTFVSDLQLGQPNRSPPRLHRGRRAAVRRPSGPRLGRRPTHSLRTAEAGGLDD